MSYQFCFGQPLKIVEQTDRTPKRAFVLGVYASAVHARWLGPDGRDVVKALAVASEPYIFWRGEGADAIIDSVTIPKEMGRLLPADRLFNGPSGIALDELFLKPLGVRREEAWLCDLVPHSCVNSKQRKAIRRAYVPLVAQYALPIPTVPPVPACLADEGRRRAILDELQTSQADILILLGDQPIKWFLHCFDQRWQKLSDFGCEHTSYGQAHRVKLDGRELSVLPLAHPRQVARLGGSSARWYELHDAWVSASGQRCS